MIVGGIMMFVAMMVAFVWLGVACVGCGGVHACFHS